MATFTKRKDGWFVQVRRKGYSARYKTLPTKAEAQAWAREQETLIDKRQTPTDLRGLRLMTLGDLIDRYAREVTPRKRGAESEASRLGKMGRAPMSEIALADLGPAVIAAYRDERLALVVPGTVRKELSLLRTIIDVARREWGVALIENPMDRVTRPAANDARDRRLHHGELERLEAAFEDGRNPLLRPFVLFAIETAMRRGEILELRWCSIDFRSRTAHLPMTKNGKPRTVPLTDKALEVLRGLPRYEERVFPLTPMAVKQAWRRLCDRAAIRNLHLHDLRHEALSRFCELGLTVPELQIIPGHRDPRMLFRYTHLRPTDLARKLAGRSWEPVR